MYCVDLVILSTLLRSSGSPLELALPDDELPPEPGFEPGPEPLDPVDEPDKFKLELLGDELITGVENACGGKCPIR